MERKPRVYIPQYEVNYNVSDYYIVGEISGIRFGMSVNVYFEVPSLILKKISILKEAPVFLKTDGQTDPSSGL